MLLLEVSGAVRLICIYMSLGVKRLRMSLATRLFLLHVLLAWAGTAVPFSYAANNTEKERRFRMPHESCLPGNDVFLTC